MSSPTPSIDSINSGEAVGSICENDRHDPDKTDYSSSSGLGPSPLDSIFSSSTKCSLCTNTYVNPKVLHCLHTFCQSCLEKILEQGDLLICPQCNVETILGSAGVDGLLSDYGISRMISGGNQDFQSTFCTSCKSGDASAVARCLTCSNFLCPSCVMAHQFMHCFEGHHVTTLGEITCNDGSATKEIKELDCINRLVQEGKSKAQEIQGNLKNLESSLTQLSTHFTKAQCDINHVFNYYTNALEERKLNLIRELEGHFSSKQMAMSTYSQKAQETVDRIFQTTDFIERLMRNAVNSEVLQFRPTLEQKVTNLVANSPEVNFDDICDFKFIFNLQAIEKNVHTTFGYISSSNDEIGSSLIGLRSAKQPPISRPIGGSVISHLNGPSLTRNLSVPSFLTLTTPSNNGLTNGYSQGLSSYTNTANYSMRSPTESLSSISNGYNVRTSTDSFSGMLQGQLQGQVQPKSFQMSQHQQQQYLSRMANPMASLCQTSSFNQVGSSTSNNMYENNDSFVKRMMASNGSIVPLLGDLGSIGNGNPANNINAWSQGAEKLYSNGDAQNQFGFSSNSSSTSHLNTSMDQLLDISGKLISQPLFPPKSQIKRQKMIYHCKFGEFGVLEGQFTEPSGVAVNAQDDIIVADTNNHRVQIFDKEGRFKFQFGECGKRDGQLLYPNRVAVIKPSGDIIVTERSPTHQVQIYNQYGQFVRKFGANILQHPRGVCVDNRGRIIVVECKVMRVIIFDQMGNVLNKFGCSKHLEFPNGVVVNDRQEIFISDNRAHCVKVFNYEGTYLRQIGGEGITNYPIGVGINTAGEVAIADNHNNFNLTLFSQDGQLLSALESKVKHAQCFDVSLMDDGSVVLASKDYRLYIYRYIQLQPCGM